MTTAIDTNVIVALWDEEEALQRPARKALEEALSEGPLAMAGVVYAELLAGPGRSEEFVDRFCEETGIRVEWELRERVWREAVQAFQGYAMRRRKQGGGMPRRILADFLIGAHARVEGYRLVTLDDRMYRAAFPGLAVRTV